MKIPSNGFTIAQTSWVPNHPSGYLNEMSDIRHAHSKKDLLKGHTQ